MAGRAFAIGLALALGFAGYGAAQAPGRTPIPLEAMIREPALSQMRLSPDGAHLAAITSLDGVERSISIWRTDALDRAPVRFGVGGAAARNKVFFSRIEWVAPDRLLVIMQQPVTVGAGIEGRTYTALARIVNLDGSQWVEPLAEGGPRTDLERYVDKFLNIDLIDQLPRDPRHILMAQATLDATFIYKVDVYTGRGERVAQLADNEAPVDVVDRDGNFRVKEFADFRGGQWVIGHTVFDTSSNSWVEQPALTYEARERRNLTVLAFDPNDPDLLIVRDDQGQNFAYIRSYSISRRAFVETMFQHREYDAGNVLIDHVGTEPTRIIGFTYLADTETPYYTDSGFRSLDEGLRRQLGGLNVIISGKNGEYRIVVAESSRQPPAYFLLRNDSQLIPLGVSTPGIPTAQLAPTQLVYYQARDGLRIPAFLTLPFGWREGDAPLPVIVQPHGGPWSRNDSSWGGGDIPYAQYFASRGFAVLQPQFRGSTGWGGQLWRAGDKQWGMAMQDDKDDGLQWLVDRRIADPHRALIYGFSYGGFAAMAATVRPNSPYRCAISGAGVASLQRIGTLWRENRIQRQLQGVTVDGMDPLQHASEANIPILIYHGDRDQTASIWHSQQFDAALRAAGKPHTFTTIPDMPHGALNPEMRRAELTLIENYIKNECGIQY
ncbi:MAG TPA: prolyl oligopeptidase family serine peptidase [Caulobacterales bacterium]|nr:prolyl oligopeptidase family serine peptidase [Caulobacterales bacterium]